ncbi:hypothetical protein [Nonomuraea phyllanthi]|uniref:hypothetical protein n=1 Tax=Nonomuraea phyllanthi TaxID=2219224 RepID=UPI00186AC901|nr:hypothetical protein [Nonomuraea phyllanthi]
MTAQDLRDVLRERAEAASPANPYRHEHVRARIRRTRVRRRAAAGATVAALVLGASVVPGVTEQRQRETTAIAGAAAELPERFTAHDGTEYRRLASGVLRAKGEGKASFTVPVSGRPLDVAVECAGGGPVGPVPDVTVNGNRTDGPAFWSCSDGMSLRPVTVPPDVTEVTVTLTYEPGCDVVERDGPCRPTAAERPDLDLAVYEWTPPAQPVEPAPIGDDAPVRYRDMTPAGSATGVWPRDSSFTFEAESRTGKVAVNQVCRGDLAGRMWFRYLVGGEEKTLAATCPDRGSGRYPMAPVEFLVPKGKRVTINGRLGMWGEHTNRPVRWSLTLYVE